MITLGDIQSASTPDLLTVVISDFIVSGDDRLLFVGVSMNNHDGDGPTQVDSVTFGLANLALHGYVENSDDGRVEIWYLVNPAVSTDDVTVTVDRNDGDCAIIVGAALFRGVNQDVPMTDMVSAIGTSLIPSVTTFSANGEMAVDVVSLESNNGNPGSVGPDQTERWSLGEDTARQLWGGSSSEPGAPPEVTMSWVGDDPGDHWAIAAVSIRPVVIPPPETEPPVGFGRQKARLDLFESLVFALPGDNFTLSPMTRWIAFFGIDYLSQRWLWTYEGDPVSEAQWAEIEQYLDLALNEIMVGV